MFRSKTTALIAACAALAVAQSALADGPADSLIRPVYLDATTLPAAPVATADPAPTLGALQMLMGPVGKGLNDAGIKVTGYVEGSWTYDFRPQAGNFINGRQFDSKGSSLQFDGVTLKVMRDIDYGKKSLDFGFTLEQTYGWDSQFIHSNGLTISSPGHTASPVPGAGGELAIHPKAQYDLIQAYGHLMIPVGNGLGIMFGKFATPMGYEVIDSSATPFFSRSFIFQQEPFTHTGASVDYNFFDAATHSDKLQVMTGFTRGWDQATNDSNGNVDIMGQIKYTAGPGNGAASQYDVALTAISGNEQPSGTQDGWRTLVDFVAHYNVAKELQFGVNAMYAFENQTTEGGVGGGVGQWYAVAAYAQFTPNDYFQFNFRGEWFDDQDGAAPTRYAAVISPTTGGAVGGTNQYYEATVNCIFTPLPNDKWLKGLHVRPEFRWDYSDHPAWNAGTQNNQWTVAVEAYFSF